MSSINLQDLEWIDVESSHIDSVAWWLTQSGMDGDVLVRFKNHAVYIYQNVPYDVFCALVEAPSVGQYLDQKIKPIYACMKLGE